MALSTLKIEQLKDLILERGLELPKGGQGTGKDGAVVRTDYISVLETKPSKKKPPRSLSTEPIRIIDIDNAGRSSNPTTVTLSDIRRSRFLENLELLTAHGYSSSVICYLVDKDSLVDELIRLFPRHRWLIYGGDVNLTSSLVEKINSIPDRKTLSNLNLILISDITDLQLEKLAYHKLDPIYALFRVEPGKYNFQFYQGQVLYPIYGDNSLTIQIIQEKAPIIDYRVQDYREIISSFHEQTSTKKYIVPPELKSLTRSGRYDDIVEARILYDYLHRYYRDNIKEEAQSIRKNIK